jgi:hypothetical protein
MIAFFLLLAAEVASVPAAEQPVCAKPTLVKRTGAPVSEVQATMERAQTYLNCMSKAIESERTFATQTLEKAKAAAQKSNDMITEVNAFVAEVKTYQEEQSGN